MIMNIISDVETKIKSSYEILKELSVLNIDGSLKLKNKIKQEINFLEKCLKTGLLKEVHLTCTNLTHLEAVASTLLKHQNDCTGIMCNKTLTFKDGSTRKICVDLILQGGAVWMKIIARNQKAITMVSKGDGSFKQKSILNQATEFIECSKQNLYYYKPPTVIFYFANGVENFVAINLRDIGVKVESQIEFYKDYINSNECNSSRTIENINEYSIKDLKIIRNLSSIKQMPDLKLNIGVTTLIAYVSSLTNGGCHYNFESDILQKHAEWERARPVKPILDCLFKGRKLYCCTSAVQIFKNILDTVGGEGEKKRGEEFLNSLNIVEDKPTKKLKQIGNVKERSLAIFGTGEYLQAVTVTANHAFIRAAMNQGIYFPVFLHESRALTEKKQLSV